MNASNPELNEAINQIVSWFRKDYAGESGFPVYDIDGRTGKPLSGRNLLCEFDDYAPFFWILGEKSYIQDHYKRLTKLLGKGGLLFSRPQIRRTKGLGLPGWFRRFPYADSQDYVEIIYGLMEIYALSGDICYLKTAEDVFERVVTHFHRQGMLRSFRLMPAGPTLPLADAMSGMFIEIACDLAEVSKSVSDKNRYLDLAVSWMAAWVSSGMFQSFGIFPSVHLEWPWNRMPGIRAKTRLAELAKPNASMAYGLLALAREPNGYKPARDAFARWIDGLYRYFATPDCVLTHFPGFDDSRKAGPVLSTNFAILDILCDAAELPEFTHCMDLALSIARFFLKYQSDETGLVPDEPGVERSYLDANSDFAVSLSKISEITGDPSWRKSGRRILDGILSFHRAPYGFYRDVDLQTGKPLSSVVETRFCSLLLKPLILYRDALNIYGEAGRWSLFRDR